MSRYNEIMQGLQDALAFVNGDTSVKATVRKVSVEPVQDVFTPDEIKKAETILYADWDITE